MCTQTMTTKQMLTLYQKLTWQNSREIVLYTVLAQIIILALLISTSATTWSYGHENITLKLAYYDLQLPLFFAWVSAFWFGKHLHTQHLLPFHFPQKMITSGKYIVSATYGGLLAILLILERYVIGAIAEWKQDYQWHISMTNDFIDIIFVLVSLYIVILTGMLYKVKPVLTIFLGVAAIVWGIISDQLFYYREEILDWLLTLQWSMTQYEALFLTVLLAPIAIIVIVTALLFMRKERG